MQSLAMKPARVKAISDLVPEVKSVTLAGGLTLPYVEQGDPAGIPVVFLHGYTDSWRSFAGLLSHLPPALHVIALSQRGHGDAGRPVRGYHSRDFSADLAAFMGVLGIESAVLAGHSMGSQIAQRFAIEHPARVRGLVLIGAFASLGRNAVIREFHDSRVASLSDPVAEAFAREFQLSTLANPVPQEFLDMAVAESLKVPALVWREALAGQMDEDVTGELGTIKVPTLLLWGDRDALSGRGDQDALVGAIPHARLVPYAGVGHAVHWEVPDRVADDLVAFVKSLAR